MKGKIWRVLIQILSERNDLVEIIKPFMENLNNNNINDEKNISILQTFSKYQQKVLYQNHIINEEIFNSLKVNLKEPLMDNKKKTFTSLFSMPHDNNKNLSESWKDSKNSQDKNIYEERLEIIISEDKVQELQEVLIDSTCSDTIITSFKDVEKMRIPLIQYCVLRKAYKCFKYLLINGKDDPKKTMDEQNSEVVIEMSVNHSSSIKRYEWDCMALAIYLGEMEIIFILEEKGIEIEMNPIYLEASILSYRIQILNNIITKLKEETKEALNKGLLAASKNNFIKGTEILIQNGADINNKDIKLNFIENTKLHFIMQLKIIHIKYLNF